MKPLRHTLAELGLAWMLGWKDVLIMGQSRALLVFVVVMPLAMVFITGLAMKGFEPRSARSAVAVEDRDQGPVAKDFYAVLERWPGPDPDPDAPGVHVEFLTAPLDPQEAQRRLSTGELSAVIVLPEGLSERLRKGEDAQVELRLGPGRPPDRRLVLAVVDGLVRRVQELYVERGAPRLALAPVPTEGPGQPLENFTAFSQAVAGNGVMFILFNCILVGGLSLVRERRQHTLDRLMIAPVGRGTIILGKVLGVYILGLVQAAVILGFGALIRVRLGNLVGIGLVTLLFILVGCALGLMIAALARREETVQMLGSPVALVMATLGGGMFPVEMGPPWMQTVALFLPTGWAMLAYHQLMWEGRSVLNVLPNLLVLAGFAAVFLLVGIRSLRWE